MKSTSPLNQICLRPRRFFSLGLASIALLQPIQADEKRTFGSGDLPSFLEIYDVDGDKILSEEERQAAKKSRKDRRYNAYSRWDTNEDGRLSKEEKMLAKAELAQKIEDKRKERFEEIDEDEDDVLDQDELATIPGMQDLGQGFLQALFAKLDRDGDGRVDDDEFTDSLDDEDSNKPVLSLEDLPTEVTAAILAEFPGIETREIKVKRKDDEVRYFQIEGLFDGQSIELKIDESGAILKVEIGEEDDDDKENEEDDDHLSLEDLPLAIQEALAAIDGLTIEEVESNRDGSVFEIEGSLNGREIELKFAPDGTILKREFEDDDDDKDESEDDKDRDDDSDEDDQELTVADLPRAIQEALASFDGLTIEEVESNRDGSVFEVEGSLNGKEIELKFAPDGTILKREIEDDDDDKDESEDDDDKDESEDDDDKGQGQDKPKGGNKPKA